jgi:hypothetical protein
MTCKIERDHLSVLVRAASWYMENPQIHDHDANLLENIDDALLSAKNAIVNDRLNTQMTDKPTHLTVEQSRVVMDALKAIHLKGYMPYSVDAGGKMTMSEFERGYRAGLNECSALATGALQYLERVTDG